MYELHHYEIARASGFQATFAKIAGVKMRLLRAPSARLSVLFSRNRKYWRSASHPRGRWRHRPVVPCCGIANEWGQICFAGAEGELSAGR